MLGAEDSEALASMEQEMYLLGSIMLSDGGKAIRWAAYTLEPDWFYYPAHRMIAIAIKALAEDGRLPDLVGVKQRLGKSLSSVGGVEYLIQVAETGQPRQLVYYARGVSDLWKRRTIRDRATKLATDAPELPLKELMSTSIRLLNGIKSTDDSLIHAADVEVGDEVGDGVPSGFASVDRYTTCRGFPKSHVTVILGPRGNGKTYLQTQHCVSVIKDDFKRAAFVTLEMTPSELLARMVQQQTGRYRRPTNQYERELWDKELAELKALPLTFLQPSGPGSSDIEHITSILRAEHELDPFSAVYLDYYQLVTTARAKDLRNDPVKCLDIVANELKALAVELQCPVIVAAQNHDQTGTKAAVDLQVKGARSLEQAAALMLGNVFTDSGDAEVAIIKNRFGAQRVAKLPIAWNPKYCRFEDRGT